MGEFVGLGGCCGEQLPCAALEYFSPFFLIKHFFLIKLS